MSDTRPTSFSRFHRDLRDLVKRAEADGVHPGCIIAGLTIKGDLLDPELAAHSRRAVACGTRWPRERDVRNAVAMGQRSGRYTPPGLGVLPKQEHAL
jgi:hypothetical protein